MGRFKEYIIVYLIIAIIITFMSGFFIGANLMKGHVLSNENLTNTDHTPDAKNTYLEIETFYKLILSPTRNLLGELQHELTVQNKEQNVKSNLINTAEAIKNQQNSYPFKSSFLIIAQKNMTKSLDKIINLSKEQKNNKVYEDALVDFLAAQKEFYRTIWQWEQENKNINIENESLLNWEEWKKASLNQKNYITASLLNKYSINTLHHPEDITVRIDTYLRGKSNQSIGIHEIIELLINSESISNKDFLKYREWYSTDTLPRIPNFVQ